MSLNLPIESNSLDTLPLFLETTTSTPNGTSLLTSYLDYFGNNNSAVLNGIEAFSGNEALFLEALYTGISIDLSCVPKLAARLDPRCSISSSGRIFCALRGFVLMSLAEWRDVTLVPLIIENLSVTEAPFERSFKALVACLQEMPQFVVHILSQLRKLVSSSASQQHLITNRLDDGLFSDSVVLRFLSDCLVILLRQPLRLWSSREERRRLSAQRFLHVVSKLGALNAASNESLWASVVNYVCSMNSCAPSQSQLNSRFVNELSFSLLRPDEPFENDSHTQKSFPFAELFKKSSLKFCADALNESSSLIILFRSEFWPSARLNHIVLSSAPVDTLSYETCAQLLKFRSTIEANLALLKPHQSSLCEAYQLAGFGTRHSFFQTLALLPLWTHRSPVESYKFLLQISYHYSRQCTLFVDALVNSGANKAAGLKSNAVNADYKIFTYAYIYPPTILTFLKLKYWSGFVEPKKIKMSKTSATPTQNENSSKSLTDEVTPDVELSPLKMYESLVQDENFANNILQKEHTKDFSFETVPVEILELLKEAAEDDSQGEKLEFGRALLEANDSIEEGMRALCGFHFKKISHIPKNVLQAALSLASNGVDGVVRNESNMHRLTNNSLFEVNNLTEVEEEGLWAALGPSPSHDSRYSPFSGGASDTISTLSFTSFARLQLFDAASERISSSRSFVLLARVCSLIHQKQQQQHYYNLRNHHKDFFSSNINSIVDEDDDIHVDEGWEEKRLFELVDTIIKCNNNDEQYKGNTRHAQMINLKRPANSVGNALCPALPIHIATQLLFVMPKWQNSILVEEFNRSALLRVRRLFFWISQPRRSKRSKTNNQPESANEWYQFHELKEDRSVRLSVAKVCPKFLTNEVVPAEQYAALCSRQTLEDVSKGELDEAFLQSIRAQLVNNSNEPSSHENMHVDETPPRTHLFQGELTDTLPDRRAHPEEFQRAVRKRYPCCLQETKKAPKQRIAYFPNRAQALAMLTSSTAWQQLDPTIVRCHKVCVLDPSLHAASSTMRYRTVAPDGANGNESLNATVKDNDNDGFDESVVMAHFVLRFERVVPLQVQPIMAGARTVADRAEVEHMLAEVRKMKSDKLVSKRSTASWSGMDNDGKTIMPQLIPFRSSFPNEEDTDLAPADVNNNNTVTSDTTNNNTTLQQQRPAFYRTSSNLDNPQARDFDLSNLTFAALREKVNSWRSFALSAEHRDELFEASKLMSPSQVQSLLQSAQSKRVDVFREAVMIGLQSASRLHTYTSYSVASLVLLHDGVAVVHNSDILSACEAGTVLLQGSDATLHVNADDCVVLPDRVCRVTSFAQLLQKPVLSLQVYQRACQQRSLLKFIGGGTLATIDPLLFANPDASAALSMSDRVFAAMSFAFPLFVNNVLKNNQTSLQSLKTDKSALKVPKQFQTIGHPILFSKLPYKRKSTPRFIQIAKKLAQRKQNSESKPEQTEGDNNEDTKLITNNECDKSKHTTQDANGNFMSSSSSKIIKHSARKPAAVGAMHYALVQLERNQKKNLLLANDMSALVHSPQSLTLGGVPKRSSYLHIAALEVEQREMDADDALALDKKEYLTRRISVAKHSNYHIKTPKSKAKLTQKVFDLSPQTNASSMSEADCVDPSFFDETKFKADAFIRTAAVVKQQQQFYTDTKQEQEANEYFTDSENDSTMEELLRLEREQIALYKEQEEEEDKPLQQTPNANEIYVENGDLLFLDSVERAQHAQGSSNDTVKTISGSFSLDALVEQGMKKPENPHNQYLKPSEATSTRYNSTRTNSRRTNLGIYTELDDGMMNQKCDTDDEQEYYTTKVAKHTQ